MNGLISTAKSLYVSSCLFAGFAIGVNPNVQIPKMLAGLYSQNISVEGLSWIVKTAEKPVSIHQPEVLEATSSDPLVVQPIQIAKLTPLSSSLKRIKRGNLNALEKIVAELETQRPVSADDFEKAALSWSTAFSTALEKPELVPLPPKKNSLSAPRIQLVRTEAPKPKIEAIAEKITVTKSSADEESKPVKSKEEQAWKEQLLSIQLNSRLQQHVLAQNQTASRAPANAPAQPNLVPASRDPGPERKRLSHHQARQSKPKKTVISCKDLSSHTFERPLNLPSPGVNNQVCPENIEWISRNWKNEGWVKSTSPGSYKTVSYVRPQVAAKTLLFDDNMVADIALKGNLSVISGSGIIIGSMPSGYKVEFLGHGEETIYFEVNHAHYFAVLNAEPGSGVVEIHSETKREVTSAFFAPVFADTVTYLELAAPMKRDIQVKIVKNDKANDPDVAGLIVAVSTQAQNHAISLSNGRALIKGAYVQERYPLYLDVTSKFKGEEGYTYRYEVDPLTKNEITLSEMSDQTLHKWLKQVKNGISDQSAMVVGFFDRKKINGFSDHHFVEVKALNGSYGFEPQTYSVLWNGQISAVDPLEGDLPRFMAVQVPEGLGQTTLFNDLGTEKFIQLTPISPRVIHVIQE